MGRLNDSSLRCGEVEAATVYSAEAVCVFQVSLAWCASRDAPT